MLGDGHVKSSIKRVVFAEELVVVVEVVVLELDTDEVEDD